MSQSFKAKSTRERVAEYRSRLREQGLRQVEIWVPDVRSPRFKAEAHRQSLVVAQSEQEGDDLAFIDSLMNWDDE
jgi:hypothetical protein